MPNTDSHTDDHSEDLELGSFGGDHISEPSTLAPHQDLVNQKLGPCLYFTIIPLLSLLLIPLFFKLSFHVLWSGILSVIPVFLFEIIASILLISIMHGLKIITVDSSSMIQSVETQLENLSFVWKLLFGVLQSFFVSSLVEEVAKALLALKLTSGGSFFSSCFKLENQTEKLFYHSHCHPLPPMVYSALAALGLSTVENIGFILVVCLKIYILTSGASQQMVILQFGAMTVIGRILLALPLHTLSGCLVGLRIAQYKIRLETQHLTEVPIFIESRYQDRQANGTSTLRKIWINLSFFCYVIYQPLIFHGLYDFILMIDLHFTLVTQSRDLHALEISQIITQSDESEDEFFTSTN
ncbi:predicted protein [Naegleria gruberi]|uniref:Predicted protein n=1 Tax=Naegleria gruberi TaxID=5762 RepID=D2VVJ7_NAEGR|nr:uncharacterized protein NAEGRDRAFT_73043 [Naegleria gruberi]EFC39124.1 predicted protein [Naegleria gruberi]|eukprot:XP_002671868.1 predicted protein [Naegleria gruberi strain NEG-M]